MNNINNSKFPNSITKDLLIEEKLEIADKNYNLVGVINLDDNHFTVCFKDLFQKLNNINDIVYYHDGLTNEGRITEMPRNVNLSLLTKKF